VLSPPRRPVVTVRHDQPTRFRPGAPLELVIRLPDERTTAVLHYRHVNQAEIWQAVAMPRRGEDNVAVIAADYTQSPYPLQYYFELRNDDGPSLFPGLAADLANQPYFVVRQA
jgi:hypothetical protein